jgi:RNA polymerase sigma factor (sigma-70 family)
MLKLLKAPSSEDLFIQRYDLMLKWGLSLTGNNRAHAEDLVHDAFIQFTLRRSDLSCIENTDAYLHRMLRNMYLSQVRRAALIQDSRFSVANFDSAEVALRAVDPVDNLTVQDELRRICEYACRRKETSKAGCVLILRFFHSYYPSEIAKLLQSHRRTVDKWLEISRREVKLYLADPSALTILSQEQQRPITTSTYARSTTELLTGLTDAIYNSRQGDCLSDEELRALYQGKQLAAVELATLSHLVTCAHCLDEVNKMLGLPPLAERNLTDRLGKDVPPDDRGTGGPDGPSSPIMESKKKYERRLKEVIEHRPQELRIAVNGFVLGAQQVSSEFNKQILTVNVDEPIGFIEVFSEQGVRLLFCDVDQPTEGSVEQKASAEFDSGRTLDLSLSFRGPWPSLNVSYHDPTFGVVEDFLSVEDEASRLLSSELGETASSRQLSAAGISSRIARPFIWLRRSVSDWGIWLKPASVTALVAVVLFAALLLFRTRPAVGPVSAAELLAQSTRQEELLAARTDQVLHRTINLEVSVPGVAATGSDTSRSQQRIEIWQSAEKGITARRLYDDKGQLIAGDWRRADGVQTIYHHAARPQLKLSQEKPTTIDFDNSWLLDLSAKTFSSLVDASHAAHVEERGNVFVISADSASSAESAKSVDGSARLLKATLTLNRADFRAIEQSLVVREGDETREYRFTESAFEQRPLNAVAPAIFEPDSVLLSSAVPSKIETPSSKAEVGSSLASPAPVMATAELEVEVLRLLNQAGADLGEQINVTRTSNGLLSVQGIVDTSNRKDEILRALSSVNANPAVKVDVKTVAEALKRTRQSRPSQELTLEQAQPASNVLPADADLRRHFSSKGIGGSDLDAEINRFANRAIGHARAALFRASALKRLTDRFSAEELRTLDPEARAKWLGMIREHARAFQSETVLLRRDLEPVFGSSSAVGDGPEQIVDDASLVRAANRLAEFARTNNEAVQSAFTLSVSANVGVAVKAAPFWRSLKNSEALAQSITRVQ